MKVRLPLAAVTVMTAFAAGARAAEISASVSSSVISPHERLILSVQVSGASQGSTPVLPKLDDFRVSDTGYSTQIQIVNGHASMSTQYEYTLVPLRTGRLTIGPVLLEDGGKTHKTEPITVEVVEGGGAPARAARREQRVQPPAAVPAGEQMFIELAADKENAYLHEQVILTFRFYHSGMSLADQPSYEAPPAPGFVEKALGTGRSTNYIKMLNGRRYQVNELKTALFPYQTGELTIGPARLKGSVLVESPGRRQRGFFDIDDFFSDPFFGHFSSKPFGLVSNVVKVKVKPLPKEGSPGGDVSVGRYSLSVEAKPLEVHVGDPITLTMSISGEGDLERIPPPSVSNLDGFKSYDPTSSTEITGRTDGIRGVKTFEQVVVPLKESVREIPQVVLPCFDPDKGKYVMLRDGPIPIKVLPAEEEGAARIVSLPAGAEKEGVKLLERHIVFIKGSPGGLERGAGPFRPGILFWAVQCIPPVVVLIALAHARHGKRMRSDVGYARLRGAGRMTRRRLEFVRKALERGSTDEFYGGLSKAMTMYVADRLNIPPGGLTSEAVSETVRGRGVPAELAGRVELFLSSCDVARYAPAGAGRAEMEKMYREAIGLLRELKRAGI